MGRCFTPFGDIPCIIIIIVIIFKENRGEKISRSRLDDIETELKKKNKNPIKQHRRPSLLCSFKYIRSTYKGIKFREKNKKNNNYNIHKKKKHMYL